LQIKKRSNQGRTPKKDIHEELEYTKGVIRAVHRRRHTRRVEDIKGVLIGGTPKKDIQEEFEDAKGVIRGRTPKKNIQ
jgi:hypothetical protein